MKKLWKKVEEGMEYFVYVLFIIMFSMLLGFIWHIIPWIWVK